MANLNILSFRHFFEMKVIKIFSGSGEALAEKVLFTQAGKSRCLQRRN